MVRMTYDVMHIKYSAVSKMEVMRGTPRYAYYTADTAALDSIITFWYTCRSLVQYSQDGCTWVHLQ